MHAPSPATAAALPDWPPPSPLRLGHGEAAVWMLRLADLARIGDGLRPLLSALDRQAVEAGPTAMRRDELLGGRGLLRLALRAIGRDDLLDVPVQHGEHGQPRLAAGRAPSFSISHGAGVVLLGMTADTPVGVDVEDGARRLPVARLARRVMHADELRCWEAAAAGDRQALFMRAWVGKEAVLKAMGTGVHGVTAQVQVLPHDAAPLYWRNGHAAQRWHATWLPVPTPLLAALVTRQQPVRLHRFALRPDA